MPPARGATKKNDVDSYQTAQNSSQKTNTLCRVSNPKQREKLLDDAAKVLKDHEEGLLPEHGGRKWQVNVRVTEGGTGGEWKKGPLFRFYGGDLELGVLPHYIDQIEEVREAQRLLIGGREEIKRTRGANDEYVETALGAKRRTN